MTATLIDIRTRRPIPTQRKEPVQLHADFGTVRLVIRKPYTVLPNGDVEVTLTLEDCMNLEDDLPRYAIVAEEMEGMR